ncbi:DNA polymerase epsilon subunit C [Emericellopsis atlantica]|uniref:DNA polymerase epsilon subunit C n=1 Tax=Emericellopsis atlantica TaxID=2614577 RepID=A0A9P7ZJ98_9HYPO|nr:DNA polymerase epsilon subunit C [Emericellopsis atlantica]KAG9253045.1 DNA polymerase epsilon subunit C [Emericellopsis atlantica]
MSPLSSGSSRQDQAKDPAKRLHRFEKEYGNLLTTWRTSSNLSRDSDAAETLEIRLQELTNILSDESRRPLPHPCIQFASSRHIYVPIGKIATTSYNEWIIKEAVLFFATLIESEEEAFVENTTFSASLTNLLVRITGPNSVRLGLDTESRVVELAFNITTKIRLAPDILPAWFKAQDSQDEGKRDLREKFAGRTQRADFPLFYILMDYIHHEGKVGDFARTGLLYIIEAASSSTLLEQWIVESDLSTLMATGLGALYSQLSRKLVIDHLPHQLPPILAFSDYQHPTSNFEVISSCSPEFQSHIETFLSHLLFWQDVLNHCKSVEVKSTLLEHFQVIFLQQLLYPSLLESSDIDGGSSVAVLTYLRRILESLDHPDMINLILHYLLALPEAPDAQSDAPSSLISSARKRKSMDLATMMASKSDTAVTPLLFNLVDLILACLRSKNQQTIYVTLQLVSAILKRHHRYAVMTLLKTEVLPSHVVHRTIGAHEQEVEYLLSLAGAVGGQDNFDDVYDSLLKDTMARLESHPCSLKLVAPHVGKNHNHKPAALSDSLPGAPREVREHTLRPDDPLLNAMLDLLETFFLNPVETNLSVTDSLVDLATCGYMSIEGWLARSPHSYQYDEDEDASEEEVSGDEDAKQSPTADAAKLTTEPQDEQAKSQKDCRRRPQWNQQSLPRLLNIVKRLCDQVITYKETVPRFDELLQQRREAFHTADMILHSPKPQPRDIPMTLGTPDRRSDEFSRSGSPSRPSAFEGLAQRLLSELGTPSRSGSPRGRRDQNRGGGSSGVATPSQRVDNYGMASPRTLPIPPPKEFPFPTHNGYRTASPSRIGDDIGVDLDNRGDMHPSRIADFAAADQTILSQRIGLPDKTIDPIPLKFNKAPIREPVSTSREDEEDEDEFSKAAIGPDADEMGDEDEDEDKGAESENDEPQSPQDPETVSVSHVVTNVMIFQSFVFELASLVQVRAGLFNEVRFV